MVGIQPPPRLGSRREDAPGSEGCVVVGAMGRGGQGAGVPGARWLCHPGCWVSMHSTSAGSQVLVPCGLELPIRVVLFACLLR